MNEADGSPVPFDAKRPAISGARQGACAFAGAVVAVAVAAGSAIAASDEPPRLSLASASRQQSVAARSGPSSTDQPAGPAGHRALVRAEASRAGLPPDLADAVAEVESGYRPGAVGAAGEVGLMQVMPPTARMLGFQGSNTELATPEVNVRYGVMYLAQAWRLAGGDICTATMKYRAGHGETRFSYLSVDYCIKVRAKLMARGYPVTGNVPSPTFGARAGVSLAAAGPRAGRVPLGGGRGINLVSLNQQLRKFADAANARAIRVVR